MQHFRFDPNALRAQNNQQPSSLNISGTLTRSFEVFLKNPILFITIMAIAVLPLLVGHFFVNKLIAQAQSGQQVQIGTTLITSFGLIVASLLASVFGQGAAVYGALQMLRDRKASFGDCLTVALSRFVPLLGTAFLISICVTLASLLFIIPGIILMMSWICATPICVLEQLGPVASVKRSTELTRGNRWTIFALIMITGIVLVIVSMLLNKFLTGAFGGYLIPNVILSLIMTIPQAYVAVMYTLIYHDLRASKEGISLSGMLKVFE